MLILVSNDDGYFAPGLAALVKAVQPFGEVVVVAPETNRSGASNSLTLDRPVACRRASNGFFYVDGTPTDCVHVALTGMLDRKPDIVLSGINNGQNMGEDTHYSGTVAAAMEGFLFGIPSIAFSLSEKGYTHLETAAQCASDMLKRFVQSPIRSPMLLNVNIPSIPSDEIKGTLVTRLGKRHASEPVMPIQSPHGETMYWIGPPGRARDGGQGTDFYALENGYISVTPLRVDLTHTDQIGTLSAWMEANS